MLDRLATFTNRECLPWANVELFSIIPRMVGRREIIFAIDNEKYEFQMKPEPIDSGIKLQFILALVTRTSEAASLVFFFIETRQRFLDCNSCLTQLFFSVLISEFFLAVASFLLTVLEENTSGKLSRTRSLSFCGITMTVVIVFPKKSTRNIELKTGTCQVASGCQISLYSV